MSDSTLPSMGPIVIAGPTASGKSEISLALAQQLGGPARVEIISADAMQLYRGMDIGTAKLPVAQRRGITHHQIDVLAVTEEASVAAYQRYARRDVQAIVESHKIPLVVGGSGLYISALVDELEFPGHDPAVRAELEDVWRQHGLAPLVAELEQVDPQAFAVIDLANPRRVIRAVEVNRITGHSVVPEFPRHTSHYPHAKFFKLERADLETAIVERAEKMFADGLLAETQALQAHGLVANSTAGKAIGYAQAAAVLAGEISVETAIEQTALATRRLARRQRTWLRPDPRYVAIAVAENSQAAVDAAVAQIVAQLPPHWLG
ncbi:MAG: tRNA (adenosine(37)-N6)-dimethylallyltransferase MiaA [Trueperella sp.]|nr:tRNA (adenosine(37)-N6)-dimethylallyltransferase MiaA [Trueperella sp.]